VIGAVIWQSGQTTLKQMLEIALDEFGSLLPVQDRPRAPAFSRNVRSCGGDPEGRQGPGGVAGVVT
jgi:hypothetical protein